MSAKLLLLSATLTAALLLGAPGAASALPIELESPPAGQELVGGEEVRFAWSPTADFARWTSGLGRIEEWEAFLSVDGGRTWTARLTPHLDLGRRSIAIRIPNLASADARLLLRFGDERREVEIELPRRFRIVAGRSAPGPVPLAPRTAPEAARPGEPEVSSWVEGDRDGGRLRSVESGTGGGWNGRDPTRLASGAREADALLPEPPRGPDSAVLAEPRPGDSAAPASPPAAPTLAAPRARPDVLLLIHRFNE
ncbi:MAG: hypothetical protein U0X73_02100 [Thermoanaerobaculia bacterium]